MVKVFIAGLGNGAKTVLEILRNIEQIKVIGALEKDQNASAFEDAESMNIPVYYSIDEVPELFPDIVLNLTGNEDFSETLKKKFTEADILSQKGSKIVFELINFIKKDFDLYHALYQNTVTLLSHEKQYEVLNSIIRRPSRF